MTTLTDWLTAAKSRADEGPWELVGLITAARTEHPAMVDALTRIERLHEPVATYDLAEDCGHPEPDDDLSPEWEAWHARHPEGEADDPICLDSPTSEPVCSQCYEDDGGDFMGPAAWPCTTLRLMALAVGAEAPTFAPIPAPREPEKPPQVEQFDFDAAGVTP